MKQNLTYFISGHRDITKEEFREYYETNIRNIALNSRSDFVVGDYHGVDILAQNFLIELGIEPERITVYHMNDKPMNINPSIFKTKGGFKDDIERDSAMTAESDFDIAFIRKGKEESGTAQNILRRHTFGIV